MEDEAFLDRFCLLDQIANKKIMDSNQVCHERLNGIIDFFRLDPNPDLGKKRIQIQTPDTFL